MDGLPIELLRGVLASLPARDLSRFAATCRAHEDLTDGVARARCAAVGVATKGLWCDGSWRVQLAGRGFRRNSCRVLRQLGSAGTRHSRQPRQFSKPTAIAELPDGRAVVCNLGSRCLTVVRLRDGATLLSIPVDGVPAGVACLPGRSDAVVVAVQGQAESGESISGVVNPTHRIEIHSLADAAAQGGGTLLWSEAGRAGLEYPNGLAFNLAGHLIATDWNNHRIAELQLPPPFGDAGAEHADSLLWALLANGEGRPSDVVLLPGLSPGVCAAAGHEEVLAVADYYSQAVRLYVYVRSLAYTGYLRCGRVGSKARRPNQDANNGVKGSL